MLAMKEANSKGARGRDFGSSLPDTLNLDSGEKKEEKAKDLGVSRDKHSSCDQDSREGN